jgi:glutathione S-transferase
MAEELVFYTNPMSRGRIVRWMLEEVGRPYRTEIMDYAELKAPSYLALNPMGKIPTLRHGETVVTECAAICAYLADAFPDAGLAPQPTDRARGAYYRWLFFVAGPLEAAITDRRMGVEPTADQRRMAGYGSFDDVLNTLEGAVSGREHLAGDRFSAADVYAGSQLAFGLRFGTIGPRPAFEAYVERLQQRPGYRRAMEIDDALVQAGPAPA